MISGYALPTTRASQLNYCVDLHAERPYFTLWLDPSAKLHRTASADESEWKPTWVIVRNGEVLLKRNAIGETAYRYFRNDP